jgi:hypothetical protein
MQMIRSVIATPDEKAYAYSLIEAATRTHQAMTATEEVRLTDIGRLKAKKILTGEERVAE